MTVIGEKVQQWLIPGQRIATSTAYVNSPGFSSDAVIHSVRAFLLENHVCRVTADIAFSRFGGNPRRVQAFLHYAHAVDDLDAQIQRVNVYVYNGTSIGLSTILEGEYKAERNGEHLFVVVGRPDVGNTDTVMIANSTQPSTMSVDFIRYEEP